VDVRKYKVGGILDGTVQSVQKSDALVEFADGNVGLLRSNQISHERVEDAATVFAVGDGIKVMVISVNKDTGRIRLSSKRLEQTPGDMLRDPQLVYEKANETAKAFRNRALLKKVQDKVDITKHKHGDVLDGTVYSVQKYGALVKLADKSTGLLHISQISHERVQDVAQVFAVGDFVKAMFLTVDQERLTLSTKQLEHRPGDMLRDPQLVYEKAKDAAAAYLQHRAKLPWMKKGSAAPRAASAR